LLRSDRFVDASPAQVWAVLLDEGSYLASAATMYRLLHAHDEVRERRAQASHPPRARPELVAAALSLYSSSMIGRVGAKGQVVIPKVLRDQVNLHPGDEVEFELKDGQIVLRASRLPAALGGRFARSGMAARLLKDRGREPR